MATGQESGVTGLSSVGYPLRCPRDHAGKGPGKEDKQDDLCSRVQQSLLCCPWLAEGWSHPAHPVYSSQGSRVAQIVGGPRI